jgi:hypothetical protein
MFSNKLPDTKSRIFGSSNESSSLYARLNEVSASVNRNKQADIPENNGLPPLRGKMPSSRQKSNTLPHLGHGPQVQQLYDDDQRHQNKSKDDQALPKMHSQPGENGKDKKPASRGSSPSPLKRLGSAASSHKSTKLTYMSPEQAMKHYMHKLSAYEHHEIFNYPQVYFLGPGSKKRQGVIGGPQNCGYDDDSGQYIYVPHDHIAYRYEVLKVIGKGSFGQVIAYFCKDIYFNSILCSTTFNDFLSVTIYKDIYKDTTIHYMYYNFGRLEIEELSALQYIARQLLY